MSYETFDVGVPCFVAENSDGKVNGNRYGGGGIS